MRASSWLAHDGFADYAGIGQYVHEKIATPRAKALGRLWASAASEVEIRHPITKVDAEIFVGVDAFSDSARLRINCRGLPDTTNPDRIAGPRYDDPRLGGFGMTSCLSDWSGYEVARIFIMSAFAVLQMHEAMEQVLLRSGGRVVDPHNSSHAPYHRGLLDAVTCGRIDTVIAVTLGEGHAKKYIQDNQKRAQQDLENEIEAGDWTE